MKLNMYLSGSAFLCPWDFWKTEFIIKGLYFIYIYINLKDSIIYAIKGLLELCREKKKCIF